MDREMAGDPDQRRRHPSEVAPAGREIEPAEVGMGGEHLLQRLVLEDGNPAGDLADLTGGAAVHLGHLAERAAEPEAVVIRDHRGLGPGILPEDVGQHVIPFVPGEIQIDVGWVLPLGIEEALEEEPGAERLDVRDPEAIAHDRVGHRAAPAVGGAVLDDVLHHQEVVGESLLADDAELELQPVASDRGDGAVAPLGAGVGEGAKPPEGLVGLRETGRHHPALGDPIGAALGDRLRLAHRLGAVGEEADEVRGRAEPTVPWGGSAIQLGESRVQVDCAEEAMPRPILRMSHDHGIGDSGGNAESPRGGEHGVALLARDQLGVEIPRAARGGDALEEGDVAGEKKEAGAVGGQAAREKVVVMTVTLSEAKGRSAAARVARMPVDHGDCPTQSGPPPLVHRQRDSLFLIGDQMRAEDRAHTGGIAGALELDRPVDAVGVGAGECPVVPLRGGGRQHLGAGDADAEGKVGMGMQVGHHVFGFCSVSLRRMYPQDRLRQAAGAECLGSLQPASARAPTAGAASPSAQAS